MTTKETKEKIIQEVVTLSVGEEEEEDEDSSSDDDDDDEKSCCTRVHVEPSTL